MKTKLALSILPTELLDRVAQHSDFLDRLALCLTSQLFYAVSLRQIYHCVVLKDAARIVQCCRAILSNKEAAHAVRQFMIRCRPSDCFTSFHNLLRAAVAVLHEHGQLTHISIPSGLFPSCHQHYFPLLRSCTIPLEDHTIEFLNNHPWLEYLSVEKLLYEPGLPSSMEPIHMPNLHTYIGVGFVGFAVVPGSRTKQLGIVWDPTDPTSFDDGLSALACSDAEITSFSNIMLTWEVELLAAVGTYLPRLVCLSVNLPSLLPDEERKQIFFTAIDDTLAVLHNLFSLTVQQGNEDPPFDPEQLHWEHATLRRWARISKSLSCAILPSGTRWLRIRSVWFPTLQIRWFITTVITSPDLPARYSDVAKIFVGKDTVSRLKRRFRRDGTMPEFEVVPLEDDDWLTMKWKLTLVSPAS